MSLLILLIWFEDQASFCCLCVCVCVCWMHSEGNAEIKNLKT